MTTTADAYINRVLDVLPRAVPRREQIATELRGHIAERVAAGQPVDHVIQQLGDPVALAESYLSAVPLQSATFLRRAAAKVVDLFGVLIVVGLAVTLLLVTLRRSEWVFPFGVLLAIFGGSLLFGLYTVVSEWRLGQTLGKRVMGLRVVRESGARISLGQAVVRILPTILEVFWIDVMFALFTEKSQRAFELLSKTRVVRDETTT